MNNVRIFSNSKKVTVTFSTFELLFIMTSLIKVIRLDKGNIKFNYRVYKIIDKIALTLNKIKCYTLIESLPYSLSSKKNVNNNS